MITALIIFSVATTVILLAGPRLAKCGDEISSLTGLGGLWIGSILIAGVTSLPEVSTSISAALINSPDIAVGNVFGSNIFNMTILCFADIFSRGHPLLYMAGPLNLLTAAFGILLSGLGALFVITRLPFNIFGVGMDSCIIFAVYICGARLLFVKSQGAVAKSEVLCEHSPFRVYLEFAIAAVAVVIAGIFLAVSGEQLAIATGISRTFIGSTLVAASTSLPELVVSIAAVRMAAYDIAVGNVLGSNIFNMVIIFLADLFFRKGPLLSAVSSTHATTALLGLILSSIVVIALFYRSQKTFLRIGWDSWLILLTYILGLLLLFFLNGAKPAV